MLRRVTGLAVLVAVSVAPGSAAAGSLGVSGSTFEYRAVAGAKDRFFPKYRRNRDFYFVPQFGEFTVRPPCSSGRDPDVTTSPGVTPTVIASCPAAGVRVADIQLGDGNDTMGILRDEIFRPNGEYDDALLPVRALVVHADGGEGNDTIEAQLFADTLLGSSGADQLAALGGNDLVRGGPGNDGVQGGDGRDRVYGDSGRDLLFGVGGTDRLYGGTGNDKINGGGIAFGADRRDTIYGEAGADKLTDTQNGKESAGDRFFGGRGNDRIDDRDGNRDIIDCGSGRDTVIADQRDKVARNCERVRRKFRPPGTR